MMRRSSCWPLLLALGVACQRPTPVTESPSSAPAGSAGVEAEAAESPAEPSSAIPAAAPTHPLELVPSRARGVLMARSPQRLAEILERERLAGQYPHIYAELVPPNYDLLDPSKLASMGVDPTGPLGIALLNIRDEAFVVFGRSPDPDALVATLERINEGSTTDQRTVGSARLVKLGRELTLVLRDGMFAFVLVDRQRDHQPDYALEVARIDPAQSVAHSSAMSRAHLGLPAEADVQAMLDVFGMMTDEMERMRRRDQESLARAHRDLAEARARGASSEELNSLQQRINSEQAFIARTRRERQVIQLLLSRTIGSIEGIGMAVDADDKGLSGRIQITLTPDSMFRDLMEPAGTPAALRALSEEPLFVASGRVDVSVAIELLAQALLADGDTYAEFNEEIRKDLKVDFDRTIRPLLTGDATFALTSPSLLDVTDPPDLNDTLGGMLAFGINDEAAARALVKDLSAAIPETKRTEVPELGGWALEFKDPARTLWLGVVDSQVVIGTDRAVFEHLRDGTAGSASRHYAHPDPWRWLTEGPAVGRLAMHHRLPLMIFFALMGEFRDFDFARDVDFELSSEFPEDDVHSIPRGNKTKRLSKQLDQAQERLQTLKDRQSRERVALAWNLTRALGMTGGAIRETDNGLLIEGGHYTDGGLGRYVETLIEMEEVDERKTSVDAQIGKATKKRDAAKQRLLDARRKELKRALDR